MTTLQQLRVGVSEAWETLLEGWQKLYRRAAGAITRFTPGEKQRPGLAERGARDISVSGAGWGVLAAEVYDDEDKVVVRLETPGMDKGDFDLQVTDNHLVVRGEKQVARERTEGRYHVTECAYGRFERAIPLPEEVEAGAASASYSNGVLRVELPKSASRRTKRIRVEVD